MTRKAYKAFDADMRCRGHQYEVGKTYQMNGKPVICKRGFHACESPLDVLSYYPLIGSRFAEVTLNGDVVHHENDSKLAAVSITVDAEMRLPDFVRSAAAWIASRTKTAASTGDYSPAASTGDRSPAASTGEFSPAASTGKSSPAASLGCGGRASAQEGSSIMLCEYDGGGRQIGCFASMVGENGIEPGVYYTLRSGKAVVSEDQS